MANEMTQGAPGPALVAAPPNKRKKTLRTPTSPVVQLITNAGVATSDAKTHTAGHSNIVIRLATLAGSLIINDSPFEWAEFAGRMHL